MDITVKDAGRGTRWVCPNDRHLALRAKLRTGWSVKTGSLDSKWGIYSNSCSSGTNKCPQSFVLTEEEQRAIIQVIQRAEALDLSEQERIGRLVERLENMKRNVCIVTATRMNARKGCSSRCSSKAHCTCSCALCGEKFGAVLGASSNLCKDCRKYICQKCGIETNELSSTCSEAFTMRERTTVQRIVRRSSSGQRQFLCRICAETREMWKKSGAWFFKGMPKYILPEKKERGWSRSAHKASSWTISGNKSLESSEPQDSSSDEETTRRLALARGQSNSFSSLERNQDSIINKTHSTLPNSAQWASSASKSSGQRSHNGLSPLNSREDGSEQLDRSTLSIASQCSRLSPSPTSPRSKTSPKASNDSQIEQRVSFEDEINEEKSIKFDDINELSESTRKLEIDSCDPLKNTQVQSIRSNSIMIPMTPAMKSTPTEQIQGQTQIYEKRMDHPEENRSNAEQEKPFGLPSNSQIALPQQVTENETRQSYGTLEVSLRYDPAVHCLQCKVERARGLQPMDIHGLADPFCKLNILPIDIVAAPKRLRTKTVHKTRDPEFNETLNFHGTTEADIWNGKTLHILILQDDPAGQDFLGEAKFPLHELQPRQTKNYNVPLQNHYPVDNEEAVWGEFSSGQGQIQMSLSYCTKRRALMVTVHRATNLLPMDSNGFSDPFVKMCLLENVTNNHQQRGFDYSIARITPKRLVSKKIKRRNSQSTTIKWKTLSPEWNEEFIFPTRLTDLMKFTLCLTVWDKDLGKSNDYLGGLELSCSSKGARLRHWMDVIRFPNHRHQAWHNLINAILPIE